MQVHVAVRKSALPLRLSYDSGRRLSDAEYWGFCQANPDLRVERSAEGDIIIVPPASGESSNRNLSVSAPLGVWAEIDRRGKAFDSSVQFMLPDGSALSPEAAWVSKKSLKTLTREQHRQFLRLAPEFIVEVRSPSDRLKPALEKMEQWIANGVQLAWFVDADAETVYVYRQGRPMEKMRGVAEIAGEGPVKGFVLKLRPIWEGLGRI
jgi:Uma2 family endonuclease